PIDVGGPLMEPLRSVADNDQAESSSFSRDKDIASFELVVVGEGVLGQGAISVGEGSKRRLSIT
nr:hypothetical protein [Tanacetum cinerariifolium]